MDQLTRREFFLVGLALSIAPVARRLSAQTVATPSGSSIDDFFRDFTADWVRHDPNLATLTRYFTDDEQDRLERQLTPQTLEWRQDRVQRARKGLAELRTFDRHHMTDLQGVSAEVMFWQLNAIVAEEPYLDYTFPLEQVRGANTQLLETLTVRHPLGIIRK